MLSHLILRIVQWSGLQMNKLNHSDHTTSNRLNQVLMILGSFHYTVLFKEPSVSTSIICPFLSSGFGYCYFNVALAFLFFRILCQNSKGLLDLDRERKWMDFNWALSLATVIVNSHFLGIKKS